MDFLTILKDGYEKNEHLHLLIKYERFLINIQINDEIFTLEFNQGNCIISTKETTNSYPLIKITNDALMYLNQGILLSELVKKDYITLSGTLRDQLLIESILFLSMTNRLNKNLVIN